MASSRRRFLMHAAAMGGAALARPSAAFAGPAPASTTPAFSPPELLRRHAANARAAAVAEQQVGRVSARLARAQTLEHGRPARREGDVCAIGGAIGFGHGARSTPPGESDPLHISARAGSTQSPDGSGQGNRG